MLLTKTATPIIFEVTNDKFEAIAEVDDYKSLQWGEAYIGSSTFEMWAPVNDKNSECLKKGNIVWLGGNTAGLIEIVNPQVEEDFTRIFDVKGRTIECLLTRRILWGTFYAQENDDIALSMQKMVDFNFVSLTQSQIDSNMQYRIMPWIAIDYSFSSGILSAFQRTGDEVYEALVELAQNNNLGFRLRFEPAMQRMLFQVYKGRDCSIDNKDGNDPVVFDSNMEDVLSSNYYTSDQDYKNIGFVAGEGTGYSRSWLIVGQKDVNGLERREIYIDARDVQSESQDEEGNTKTLTEKEYNETLSQRGEERLAERAIVETFDSKLRVIGDVNYEYGKDYFLGDTVTVIDRELGVRVNAQVTNVEEAWSDKYELVLTFGFAQPTILEKVKTMLK